MVVMDTKYYNKVDSNLSTISRSWSGIARPEHALHEGLVTIMLSNYLYNYVIY